MHSNNRFTQDTQNSAHHEELVIVSVMQDVNDSHYCPKSFAFPHCHSCFNEQIELSMSVGYKPFTEEDITSIVKGIYSILKRCVANCHQSGNGRSNVAEESILIRIHGMEYADESNNTIEVTMVDDGWWNFWSENIVFAYFWNMVEMLGLAYWVSQNVNAIGLTSEKAVHSARDSGNFSKKIT